MSTNTEPSDVQVRYVLLALLLLTVILASVLGLLSLIFGPVESAAPPAGAEQSRPEPALQTDPSADLQRYRRRALQRLSSYGWVDRSAGIAHIPIDRAMALRLQAEAKAEQRTYGE